MLYTLTLATNRENNKCTSLTSYLLLTRKTSMLQIFGLVFVSSLYWIKEFLFSSLSLSFFSSRHALRCSTCANGARYSSTLASRLFVGRWQFVFHLPPLKPQQYCWHHDSIQLCNHIARIATTAIAAPFHHTHWCWRGGVVGGSGFGRRHTFLAGDASEPLSWQFF
jgi:hypothetical protein